MAKAYTFSSSGGLVPVDILAAGTSLNIASGAFSADTDGVVVGANKNITLSGTGKVTGLATPENASDAATMAYVQSYADSVASGLDVKRSVALATAEALAAVTYANGSSGVGATLTADANGALSVDGVSVSNNDRILVKDQASALQNGIYVVSDAGGTVTPFVLTRATDADTGGANGELTPGAFSFVEKGSTNADTGWVLSSPDTAITMGTTAISFTQFSSAGIVVAGAGLTKTGNTLDVVSANSAIVANADNIELTLATNSGLEISSGLMINLDSDPGLVLGSSGIKIDFGTLADGSSGFTASADSIAIMQSGVSKYANWSSIASSIAGNGIAAASGSLSVDLNELNGAAVDVGLDYFPFIDATDSSSAKATIASLVTAMAGSGLTDTSGVLSVGVDSSTIEITGDSLNVKDYGIVADKLAANSVTTVKITDDAVTSAKIANGAVTSTELAVLSASEAASGLVSDADFGADPAMKALYLKAGSGKLALAANSQAGMHIVGLCASSSVGAADTAVDLYSVDGSFLAIPSAARNGSFSLGAIVYADASGILSTDFANDFASNDWCCPVGVALAAGSMILRIGMPFQKA